MMTTKVWYVDFDSSVADLIDLLSDFGDKIQYSVEYIHQGIGAIEFAVTMPENMVVEIEEVFAPYV